MIRPAPYITDLVARAQGEIPQDRREGANKVLQLELSGNRLC